MIDSLRPFIESRSPIPILETARVANGRVTVTNLAQTADAPAPWSKGIPACCIPYTELAAFLGRAGDAPIKITSEGHLITLRAGRMSVKLPMLPVEDFPHIVAVTKGDAVTIPGQDIKAVAHSMAKETTRAALCGVSLRKGMIEACDGQRMIRRKIVTKMKTGIILPDVFVRFLAKVEDESLILNVTESLASCELSTGLIATTKLIDAVFPDLERVWPANSPLTTSFDSKELKAALETVSMVGNHVSISGKQMLVRGDVGKEAEYDIDFTGDPMRAAFNIRFLQDMMAAHVNDPMIKAQWSKEEAPFLFNEDELILPLRS